MKADLDLYKPIKAYDTNKDGKIDAEEAKAVKKDCESIYSRVYGKDSKENKTLSELLSNSELIFKNINSIARVCDQDNDYEAKKYKMELDSTPFDFKLKDADLPVVAYSGYVVHEAEHLRQMQKDYDDIKASTNKSPKEIKKELKKGKDSDRYELYAELKRMIYMYKLDVLDKNSSPVYKNFVDQVEAKGLDPINNKEEFLQKFNKEEFLEIFKKGYKGFDKTYYHDPEDKKNYEKLFLLK